MFAAYCKELTVLPGLQPHHYAPREQEKRKERKEQEARERKEQEAREQQAMEREAALHWHAMMGIWLDARR